MYRSTLKIKPQELGYNELKFLPMDMFSCYSSLYKFLAILTKIKSVEEQECLSQSREREITLKK